MRFTGKGLFLSPTSAQLPVWSDTGDALEAVPVALQFSSAHWGPAKSKEPASASGEEKGSRAGEAE